MGSTARESITPGRAASRPGVWLTDATLIAMAVIWGVNFSVVKFGTSLVDPLAYNGVRVTLAAVLLSTIVLLGSAALPSRKTMLALLGLGVLGNGIYQFFFVEGLALAKASDAALVIAASPAFIAIIGRVRGVERVSKRGALGIALSILGIGLVALSTAETADSHATLIGDLLVLVGSLAWAVYTVLLKPYTERVPGMQLSALTMLGGALSLLVISAPAIVHAPWTTMPALGWGALVYSGVFALVIAYYFWYRGVRVIGPTRTAMYSNLQPVVGVLMAWLLLHETPTVWQLVGAASIMGGLLLTRS